MKTVTLMIPCYNEEKGIGKVVKAVPKQRLREMGYAVDILVIDNNSKDQTTAMAKKAGARVVFEEKQGKGNALQTGFKNILKKTAIVAMIDGDDSYDASQLDKIIQPILDGKSDIVMGSRLNGGLQKGAMTKVNFFGNKMFSLMARTLYDRNVEDLETGFVAWKRPVADNIAKNLQEERFGIEPELLAKAKKLGYTISTVSITYRRRLGDSSLHPLRDGSRVLHALIAHYFWQPKKGLHQAR
jgi:glycosyltransferase involved in cell wall biosynthesis